MNPTWLYVAAVYALAVWLARRGGVELRWRMAAFFYLLVLLFLFRPMTQAYVNLPVDFLKTLPPWAYLTRDHHTVNRELNDLVLQIVPWAHQARESWKSLHAPLWNPFAGSGYVLLANGQSSALSPLRLLALPLPLGYAFTAEAAWKLLVALTFAFLFCRRRGYAELASATGAICFGFSTFLVVWLHFPLVTVAAFLPAVLYAVDLLRERRSYGRFLFAALLWTVMLFGGHPETVSHAFFLALLYVGWILAVERPFAGRREALRFAGTLAAALAVAGLLAMPFLAPFAEAVTKSKRYQELQASPNAIGYYSDWPSIIVLLQPHFSGALPLEKPWLPATAESITGFTGALGIAAWLALAVDVVVRRRFRSFEAFLVVATLVVVGIFLAWPGVSTLFHLIFKLAANARLRLLFCLLLAVATAAMVDAVQRGFTGAWLAGILGSAALLLYLVVSTDYPTRYAHDNAVLAVLPSVCVLLAAALVALLPRWREAALLAVMALIVGELWAVGRDWNPVLPERLMYPSTPLLRALDELRRKQPPNQPFRVVGTGPVFFPNVSTLYGLEDIRAHDPMANGRYLGVLRVVTGYDTTDYFAKWDNLETRVLDFLGVKYVIAPPRAELDPARYSMVYDGRDGRIFENHDALPRFYPTPVVVLEFNDELFVRRLLAPHEWWNTALLEKLAVESDQMRVDFLWPRPPGAPVATLEIVSATPTDCTLRVHAPRWSLIVSSIPWWPGWKIERFGRRADPIRVNGGFLGFAVPPGVTDVRVHSVPWTWKGGVAVSLLTALALAAVPLRRRLR